MGTRQNTIVLCNAADESTCSTLLYIHLKAQYCVAGGKSGNFPGRNLPTRTVVNLRSSLVLINQSILNLLRVHFIHTELGEPQHSTVLYMYVNV
jgi:hypothetical protein